MLLEVFNEALIMFSAYSLFLFTDFVPMPQTRYYMGFALMSTTLVNLGAELILVLARPVCANARVAGTAIARPAA